MRSGLKLEPLDDFLVSGFRIENEKIEYFLLSNGHTPVTHRSASSSSS